MPAFSLGTSRGSAFCVDARTPDEQNLLVEPQTSQEVLTTLDDDGHRLLRPITIEYARAGVGYIASFGAVNIAISGVTKIDARQALEIEILDAFDDWTADESVLGPGPRQQLAVLKQFIARNP
jgi:hypothetical protein